MQPKGSLYFAILLSILTSGCQWFAKDEEEEDTYPYCGENLTESDLINRLSGTWVIAARNSKDATTTTSMLVGLILAMVRNGIDFTSISDYELDFDDGHYVYTDGKSSIGFSFQFVSDFGAYEAGETVPLSLFDIDSYVEDIELTATTYSFDEGTLYDLVVSGLPTSGSLSSYRNLEPKLNGNAIEFVLDSKGSYRSDIVPPVGKLTIKMGSTARTVQDIINGIEAEGFGFTYDDTEFNSDDDSLIQSFYSSEFIINEDEDGGYWAGEWQSTIDRDDELTYLSGELSQRENDTINYYCDKSREDKLGTMTIFDDDDESTWEFVYEDGTIVGTLVDPELKKDSEE